jgi:hypothetical protein
MDWIWLACLLLAIVALTIGGNAVASAQPVEPFSVTYNVEWKGMTAGTAKVEVTNQPDGTYKYRSSNLARGVFRVAFPDAITQTSTFKVADDGTIQPLTYLSDDGSKKTDKDVSLTFDWNAKRARGTAENKPVDTELKPGTQDALTVQIQLMRELAAGRSPTTFWLIDKNEAKEYQYSRERTETIDTALGKVETVVYRSQRKGSDRYMLFWLSPNHMYLPVKAERHRGDRLDFSLKVRELKKG